MSETQATINALKDCSKEIGNPMAPRTFNMDTANDLSDTANTLRAKKEWLDKKTLGMFGWEDGKKLDFATKPGLEKYNSESSRDSISACTNILASVKAVNATPKWSLPTESQRSKVWGLDNITNYMQGPNKAREAKVMWQ